MNMKNLRLLALASLLTAVIPVNATFESARIAPDNEMPQYPLALKTAGITRGHCVIAISVDETGRVKDTLVLAYTQKPLAKASVDVLKNWRFIPAKLDGVPVPVQTELRFDYTLEGAVITANILNHFLFDGFENVGDNAVIYRPGSVSKLDRRPVRIGGEAPRYSALAERDGIRGKVKVRFYIDESGDVKMPAALADHVHPYLLEEAVAAVRTWKFEPALSQGEPVLVAAMQEFRFGADK
jgi:TonB family protein